MARSDQSPSRLFSSKREFVCETLRAEIIAGTRAPGERLIIDDLANALGVSPIPVREALQQLQADGLVAIEPYVGARVADIHVGLIEEVFALLEAFEVLSSRHACVQMVAADFAYIEGLLRRMDDQLTDPDRWSQNNVALHRFISDRAGLRLTPTMMDRVLDQWRRFRRHYLDDVFAQRAALAQQDHWLLFAALQTRDPDHVEAVVRAHNRRALEAYQRHLQQMT